MKNKYLVSFIGFVVVGAVLIALCAIGGTDLPSFKTDPTFNLPIPHSYGSSFPTLPAPNLEIVCLVIIIASLVASVFLSIKKRSWLPSGLMLSFFLLYVAELFADVLVGIWPAVVGEFPIRDDNILFWMFGRPVSSAGLLLFVAGFAVLPSLYVALIFRLLNNDCSTRALWVFVISFVALNFVVEEIMLRKFPAWEYFGSQPLTPIDIYPLYLGFLVSGSFFSIAAVAYKYREAFRSWKVFSMLVITPAIFCGMLGFAAVPASIAIYGTNMPWIVVQLLGVLTIGLALTYIAAFMKIFLGRDPFDLKSHQE